MSIFIFAVVFFVDFCLHPLSLIATAIFSLFDSRKQDLQNYSPLKKSIILIHGTGNNQSEWLIARIMLAKKYNVFSFNYAELFSNDPNVGPSFYAQNSVRREINLIKRQTGCNEFILIGHSMGGLIAVDYAKNIAQNDNIKILKTVTISAPWNGAPLAKLKSGKHYADMTTNSDYLDALKTSTDHLEIYSVASTHDWAVPSERGLLNKNKNYKLYTWYGHYSIVMSPFVWNNIIAYLK